VRFHARVSQLPTAISLQPFRLASFRRSPVSFNGLAVERRPFAIGRKTFHG